VLNRAWYEFEHHAPLLLNATDSNGATVNPALLHTILTRPLSNPKSMLPDGVNIPDEKHALVIALTDSLTLLGPVVSVPSLQEPSPKGETSFGVPKEIISELESYFVHKEIVELVAIIAAYNCVSRFLVALDVGEREGQDGMETAIKNVARGKGGDGFGKLVLDTDGEVLEDALIPVPRFYPQLEMS
jgi:hypothetical protein